MSTLKLSIPRCLESRNEYGGPKGHWKLQSHKKNWEQAIGEAFLIVKANGKINPRFVLPCEEIRRIQVEVYRKRLIDPDNLSLKAMLDAMKRLGFIKDDSARWLEIKSVKQFSIGKKGIPYTKVTLW